MMLSGIKLKIMKIKHKISKIKLLKEEGTVNS